MERVSGGNYESGRGSVNRFLIKVAAVEERKNLGRQRVGVAAVSTEIANSRYFTDEGKGMRKQVCRCARSYLQAEMLSGAGNSVN